VVFGRLLEAGEAPYRFEPHAQRSPYVRLATEAGERVLWGVDFPRALAEASTRPQPGDAVGVQYLGKRTVTVSVPVKAEDGSLQGHRQVERQRNTWLVEKRAYFEAREQRAAALRDATTPKATLAAAHPELAAAIAWVHLAERLARRDIAEAADRERFVAMVREGLAQAIGRSQAVTPPKLRVQAREPAAREHERVPVGPAKRTVEQPITR